MTKIKITQSEGDRYPQIEIDGNGIPYFSFSLEQNVKSIPVLNITTWLKNCEITTEGIVKINGLHVNEEISRQIYKQLKKHFE